MKQRAIFVAFAAAGLTACAAVNNESGTLAVLQTVEADIEEVYLDDSLERAAQSYRRYLEETAATELTPEAMRRLADLQLEREFGIIGRGVAGNEIVTMAAPEAATIIATATNSGAAVTGSRQPEESEQDFERRAPQRQEFLSTSAASDTQLPGGERISSAAGPREAIKTYRKILETYPNYERNDQVLYQMSRAYDEIGQPEEAMAIMERLIAEYGYSDYLDEVYFRRGEFYFVRKRYLDAEDAYKSIVDIGKRSSYYELALYKLGWALYKQDLYEEALHRYMAMLDYRLSIGFDFDRFDKEDDEHRVVDTFRVISLSFSNLGGDKVADNYFAKYGHRSYADKIYSSLGEFYFAKLRYEDAASVYRSFIALNPRHRVSPHFNMRVIEIYDEAGFPRLVVEAKKEFATQYALSGDYWSSYDAGRSEEVVGFLKTNLSDLANHYHAQFQNDALVDERPTSFQEAQRWYRQFLGSFPRDPDSPPVNYQLADLLLENQRYGEAALEYERTAYAYAPHEQSPGAGYAAVYAHREDLKAATDERQAEVRQSTVRSSLKFADVFPDHEQAPIVLGAAADDLYGMQDFIVALESAHKLIARYPDTESSLRRSAWTVIGHASIDIEEYSNAELAYVNVLALSDAKYASRDAIIDSLAASIYQQGQQANEHEDYRAAANHFLRIKDVAPTSAIRTTAEYDAAAALVKLTDWTMASTVLEAFRAENPEHELIKGATRQLAFVYREDGQIERSASEYERVSADSDDQDLSREALLTAGALYDDVASTGNAIRVYEKYVADFPRPLDIALETRSRLAEMFMASNDQTRYEQELRRIVEIDRDAGAERSDRSRYLAANAALVLVEKLYRQYSELRLRQPFEESLAQKQRFMDAALAGFEGLVSYEVSEVTAAATYYIAEIYFEFSTALLQSERPDALSSAEKVEYDLVIEDQAFPFEERGIEVHEQNFSFVTVGIYNKWVQKSLDKLAVLMPGRYAKNEISGGFIGSIDVYAYRMPIAPPLDERNGSQEATAQNLEMAAINP